MHVNGALATEFVAQLADRLEERQAFDIAHRAADLAEHEIDVVVARQDEFLDRVGDMGDHLHRASEIIAPALLCDDVIDASRGYIVGLRRRAGEPLVMAEIEIGLRAVVGDEDLPVLKALIVPGSTFR